MQTIKYHLSITSLFLLFTSSACYSAPKEGEWTLGTGTSYSSGDYGNPEPTNMLYIPVSLQYKQEKWRVRLTVPYIKMRGPQNVIRNIGQIDQEMTVETDNRDGLGDVLLSGRYQLFYLPKSKLLIDVAGKIKFGTANSDTNLGTGENDYSLIVGLYKKIGGYTPYVTFGRRFYGQSPDFTLDDVFYGSAGLDYKMSAKTNLGANFYLKDRTADTRPTTQQLVGYLGYKLDTNWKIQGYLSKGFTENTADYGGGFSLRYTFD